MIAKIIADHQLFLGAAVLLGLALLPPSIALAATAYQELPPLSAGAPADYLVEVGNPITLSRFGREIIVVTEGVPFETLYRDDPEILWGEEHVAAEGRNGRRQKSYELATWEGREVGRRLLAEELTLPEAKVILRGTKLRWQPVPGTDYKAWGKVRVWATSYDGNCRGCSGVTYTGTVVHLGVCAVDPKLISLGTTFYVPGYGLCRAEDIGGAIKGKKVDLGFEDVRRGFWSARYTDIYLISNPPER